MKRGQATLLIAVGIIIVLIVALMAYYSDQVSETLQKTGIIKKEALDVQAETVTQAVESCLDTITGDAVLHVAANGGYLLAPDGDAAYYARGSQLEAPPLADVEDSVSEYISQMIPFCTFGEKFNADVEPTGDAHTSAKILEDKVQVNVDYPLRVSVEDASTTTGSFAASIPARIGLAHKMALSIADLHKDKAGTCFSCLFEESSGADMKIDVYNPELTEDMFFMLTDEKVKVDNEPLVYIFAIGLGGLQ